MKVRSILLIFTVFFSFTTSASNINSQEVNQLMSQLFKYHVTETEMNPAVMKRALNIYVTNFDPNQSYLIKKEVSIYSDPTPSLLSEAVNRYQNNDHRHFFVLNEKIEVAIVRARSWRQDWIADPDTLVTEALEVSIKPEKNREFAKTLEEARQRHRQFFTQLISINLQNLGEENCRGKEGRLVALCEKQIILLENGYLGLNDEGEPVAAEEREHKVLLRMIKSMAASLDTHTAFFSPDEAMAMRVQLEKGMCGIGVVLQEGIDGVVIREMVKGGPAEKSGKLQPGDTILAVDGTSINQYSFRHVLEVMRGKEGTKMGLKIQRPLEKTNAHVFDVTLVREKITLDGKRVDVESEPFGDGVIGKLTLHSFYEGKNGISSEGDLKTAINELREQGPLHGLVLDLRDNGGGFLSQAVKVTGLFIKSGVVVIAKYSDDSTKYFRTLDLNRFYDGPLVVLVSRLSASASEIVAQALQDYGVALIVGDEQTYGKGTIQHQTVTDHNSDAFFKVTIGRYYTVSGKSTQIEGVKSDIVIPTATNFEEIGEGYLDYPLQADRIASAYKDDFSDVDPQMRRWFRRYYTASMQAKSERWQDLVPTLRANSQERVDSHNNYQIFLKNVRDEAEEDNFGVNDLQMDESVNILKEMIYLQKSAYEK